MCDLVLLHFAPTPLPATLTRLSRTQITDSSDEEEGGNDPGVKQKTLIEVCAGVGFGR